MIKIDKQQGPKEAMATCAELTARLTDLYGALRDAYSKKNPKNGDVQLTDADYVKFVQAYSGTKPKAKTSKTLAKAIPPVVFGTELIASTKQNVVTAPDLQTLAAKWDQAFTSCMQQYDKLCRLTAAAWRDAFTKRFPPGNHDRGRLETVLDQVPLHYLWRALGGRPFVNLKSAQSPQWFQPGEFEQWTAFDGVSPQLHAALFSIYQTTLAQTLDDVLDEDDTWLAPTVWMYGLDAPLPDKDALFTYAVALFKTRMSEMTGVNDDLYPAELKALRKILKQDGIRRAGQYYVAVHALREVVANAAQATVVTSYAPLLGFKSATFDSAWYSGHGIKEALMNTHHGKCVFCESKVRSLAHGDVEHFRPKAGYDQGHQFNTSGYFWQAYRWENLFFSCQVCNQVYKANHFPVLLDKRFVEVRQSFDDVKAAERPVLVDPGQENPRDHIRFDPRTGRAYPYGLLGYAMRSRGIKDPDKHIWSNPDTIPTDLDTQDVSVDLNTGELVMTKTDGAEWGKLPATAPDDCLRGLRTIQIIGLNRWELVHRRIAHLRALRGLFLASQSDEAARDALAAAQQASAEFSSLAIDAIATWTLAPTPTTKQPGDWWLKQYNALLSTEPEYTYDSKDDVEFKDASWMYFVPAKNAKLGNTTRYLVYLKQDAELDDVDRLKAGPGWYLAVPPEDDKLWVIFKRTSKTEKIKLRELGKQNNVWTKFRNAEVTVSGPFSSQPDFS